MYEIFDEFCWTKEQKTITRDKHGIRGLGNFAHWNLTSSLPPVPMHYHSNMLEMHCMIKGTRQNQIAKDGKISDYSTMSNQAFLTFPFEIHGTGDTPRYPCEFYSLQIDLTDPYHLFGLNRHFSFALHQKLTSLRHHQLVLGTTHIEELRSAFNLVSEDTPDTRMAGVQFLTCFLFCLQFLTPAQKSKTMVIDPHIRASMEYMRTHISEKLQLSELADIAGYSLSFFKVKFKKEVGITPAEYINLQKFEAAKKLLTETNQSITDIAYSLGFSSSGYFSSVFRRLATCTPQAYRKTYTPSMKNTI